MKKHFDKAYIFVKKYYKKVLKLPKSIRYPLGIVLIMLWIINIINPFLNWIFMILVWVRLISEDVYRKLESKLKKKKKVGKTLDKIHELDIINDNIKK